MDPVAWLGRERWVRRTRRWLGSALAGYGLFMLLVSYTPVPDYMVQLLWVPDDSGPVDAIVVLTAWVSEEGVMNEQAMRRVHRAAQLYRSGVAPLMIVSGGDPSKRDGAGAAERMAEFAMELGVPETRILLERESENTHASAVNVSRLAEARGIRHVMLVTDAAHMTRAAAVFRAQGLGVSASSADPWSLHWEDAELRRRKFWAAVHEYGGLLYYWYKGWI